MKRLKKVENLNLTLYTHKLVLHHFIDRNVALPPSIIHKARKFSRLLFKKRAAFPREIQIEITNRCNLDCDMCPRLSLLKVPEIDMSSETFQSILDSLKQPRSITLTGWGEPLMHPQFFSFVDDIHARFPSCEIHFTTNAFLLDEDRVRKILLRPFTRVTFSLEELPWEEGSLSQKQAKTEALDPKKGHKNALVKDGHPSSDSVVEGIRRLVRGRELKKHPLELRLQAVMSVDGMDILKRLIDFAADEKLDVVNLVRLDVRGRPDLKRPDWQSERAMIAEAKAHGATRSIGIASVNDHDFLMKMAAHNDQFCMRLDDYVYIDVHGQVAPCCLLRSHTVGSIQKTPLKEIWQGPELKKFYGPKLPSECSGCDSFLHGYAEKNSPETLSV